VRVAQDAIYGHKYNNWIRRHIPNEDTGMAPRFALALSKSRLDHPLIEDYSYNRENAIAQLFQQGDMIEEEVVMPEAVPRDGRPDVEIPEDLRTFINNHYNRNHTVQAQIVRDHFTDVDGNGDNE